MTLIDAAADALADALRDDPRFGERRAPRKSSVPRVETLALILAEMAQTLADVLRIDRARITPRPDPARRSQSLPLLFCVSTGEEHDEPDAPTTLRFAPIPEREGYFFLRGRCQDCPAPDVAVAVITSLAELGYYLRHRDVPYNAGWTLIGRDPGHAPDCVWVRRAAPEPGPADQPTVTPSRGPRQAGWPGHLNAPPTADTEGANNKGANNKGAENEAPTLSGPTPSGPRTG